MSLKQTLKTARQLESAAKDGQLSLPPIKPRNPLANDPLLKKGGVHAKDDVRLQHKKQRHAQKRNLRQVDWLNAQ